MGASDWAVSQFKCQAAQMVTHSSYYQILDPGSKQLLGQRFNNVPFTRFLRCELPSRNSSACWAAQMDFLSVACGLRSPAGSLSTLELGVRETQLLPVT